VQKIIQDHLILDFDYALMPDIMHALKKFDTEIIRQEFGERGLMEIGIRKSETRDKLLRFRAYLWRVSLEEAEILDWPPGMKVNSKED
jgi:hypothetical protein